VPDPLPTNLSRRDFLALLTRGFLGLSGLLGIGVIVRFLGFQNGSTSPTRFEIGPVDRYPLNSRTLVPEARAVVVHTSSGLAAYSLICPHLGCTVQLSAGGYACPCHGSRFGPDGALQNGPAEQPLQTLKLEQTPSGELVLYTA
jgi:cytochrome b6-f complex iron-sulfur subunit